MMNDVEGEVRVRSVRSVRSDSFVETAMEFGGGIVRLGFSLFTLPLALLPTDTRHHMQNATKELMYAFASLPRDFAAPASSHALGLADTLAMGKVLALLPPTVIVVAIEGEGFETGASLSPAVTLAIDAAADLVLAELHRLVQTEPTHA